MMLDSYKIVYFFSALCFYELIKSVEVWKFKMRKSRSDMGWWDGRGKTFRGAQQGTYQGYCALTLCYHWMKVVLKFGLDVNINTNRIRMYAPQIQYVISHFIEKDGTTKQVAIDTHNQLLESTKNCDISTWRQCLQKQIQGNARHAIDAKDVRQSYHVLK